MTSQTVTGDTLQFTDDNKHCFGYGGLIDVINAEKTLLTFNTNSEYIDSKLSISNTSGSGDDFRYFIYFNDVAVLSYYAGTSDVFNQFSMPQYLIVPPFTTVKITATNISSGSARSHSCIFTGKVGMPPRVGN